MLIKAKLITNKEVPYLCGYSKNGKNVYFDKRLNPKFKLKDGREVDGTKYLMIHEETEKKLEDKTHNSYQWCHEQATGAERKAVEADGIPWQEYQNYMLSEVKKLTKLDSKVPKDIDEKPEHDEHDTKMLKEIAEHKVAKAFQAMYGYILHKATGEGSRGGHVTGHTANGKPIYGEPRKPYPGEDAHNLKPTEQQKKQTYMPPDGTNIHYADSANLKAYKQIMRYFKQKGWDFQGHITYDPKKDTVATLSPDGQRLVKQILAEHAPGGKDVK